MRLYWEITKLSFRQATTYRGATVAGVFTNTVFGFLLAYVLLAVYQQRSDVNGFDATQAVTFTFVAQGMLMVVGMFGSTEIADRISAGDVVIDLYRPIDFQLYWLAEFYGKSGFYAFFRGVPPFLVGAIAFHLQLPADLAVWPAFAVSVVLAAAVAFGWWFLVQTSAFWLLDVRGPNSFAVLIAGFLSGLFVPLFLFPSSVLDLIRLLPFASMLQLPVEVFLGKHQGAELLGIYALQAFWAVALIGCGRLVLARAMRRVVVQGG